ncbi:unnamed protein product, partial [Phaeothamnion confervicola]
MLEVCVRKAGDALLDEVRRQCQRPRGDTDAEAEGEAEQALAEACHMAALLGKARQAANIYGGHLRARLRIEMESAMKRLASQRALHRLNMAAGGAGLAKAAAAAGRGGGGEDSDAQPHVTALAAVLGAASKCMAKLARAGLDPDATAAPAALLHGDCLAQAAKVLDWFDNDSTLSRWQEQASAIAHGGKLEDIDGDGVGGAGEGKSGVDVQGMDFIVDELAFISQLCQRYLDFSSEDMGVQTDSGSDFLARSQRLEGVYVQLEDAYCLASVAEAVRIAEPIEVADGICVSSMVEDGGFLLQVS